ncbi:uncharacterized protein LOC8284160 isoform X1 [Ricinus communis]|uniref:uncharacterized protein LOC8284160 isoform X1 n=1 Tax=Ricinus communis TaxID=3988 RepID=UPI00201A5186|nr:uncharacterized protein LOC8284160 isoform X1 [Ricinus communis]
MAQVVNLNSLSCWSRPDSAGLRFHDAENGKQSWVSLQQQLKCNAKFTCLFSGSSSSRKEEQARKALESALGGKKSEFEKWNKEIQKREEAGGGGTSGGGGWFGWGGRFGWSNGDNFWPEAQQAALAILVSCGCKRGNDACSYHQSIIACFARNKKWPCFYIIKNLEKYISEFSC